MEHVLSLPVLTTEEVFSNKRTELKEVQVHYLSGKDFTAVAKQLKIMSDLKVLLLFRISVYNLVWCVCAGWYAPHGLQGHSQLHLQWQESAPYQIPSMDWISMTLFIIHAHA